MPVKLHRDVVAHDQGEGRRGRRRQSEVGIQKSESEVEDRDSGSAAVRARVFLRCSFRPVLASNSDFYFDFSLLSSILHARTAVAERTLPHNLEAERSVLGAILLHNDAFNLAAEVIDSQRLLPRRAPAHLRQDGEADRARRRDRPRHAQGGARRGRASSTRSAARPTSRRSSTACRARPTSSTTRASSRRRRPSGNLIFSANKILATAYEAEEDADVILDQAEHAIFAIADDKVRDGFVSLRDLAQTQLRDDREAARAQGAHHRRADRLHRSRRDDVGPAARRTSSSSPRGRRWGRRASR